MLTRPANQLLLVFAAFPLVFAAVEWRRRLAWAGAFLGTAVVLLGGWATYNDVRFDDFAVARNVGGSAPMYRVQGVDRLVAPENGPASRELGHAVATDILTREPYKSYGVDLREFFMSGDTRMWADLASLSDRRWGWDSDYSKLSAVTWEAVKAHPRGYARAVGKAFGEGLTKVDDLPAPKQGPRLAEQAAIADAAGRWANRAGARGDAARADARRRAPRRARRPLHSDALVLVETAARNEAQTIDLDEQRDTA